MRITNCEMCWVEIANNNGSRKVCSKCRRIRDKELRKINDEKKKLLRLKNKKNEVSSNENHQKSAV